MQPDRDTISHEHRGRRGRAEGWLRPDPPDRSAEPWAYLQMSTRRVVPGVWSWLRAALRDIGYPVSGWSFGRDGDNRLEISLKGDPAVLIVEIVCLWDNEKPGVPLTIARR